MDPVRIGSFANDAEAHAARGYLLAHGIHADIVSDESAGLPSLALRTPASSLLVPAIHADEARLLLEEVEEAADPDEGSAPTARSASRGLIVAVALVLVLVSLVLAMIAST